jgi:hypothetical protein
VSEVYPRIPMDMEHRIATEAACREYLFRLLWSEESACLSVLRHPKMHENGPGVVLVWFPQCAGEHLIPRVHRGVSLLKLWPFGIARERSDRCKYAATWIRSRPASNTTNGPHGVSSPTVWPRMRCLLTVLPLPMEYYHD